MENMCSSLDSCSDLIIELIEITFLLTLLAGIGGLFIFITGGAFNLLYEESKKVFRRGINKDDDLGKLRADMKAKQLEYDLKDRILARWPPPESGKG